MKYRVRHATRYRYAEAVNLASHVLHMEPRSLPHQAVLSSKLVAVPLPARTTARRDHFGNCASWMFLDLPHDRFEVTLDAVVEVAFPRAPEASATPPWEQVVTQARSLAGWDASEFLLPSGHVPLDSRAGAYVAASFPLGRPVLSGLMELIGRIRKDFTFRAGVTNVATPVSRVLAQRAGVCQDFSHLMISGLRTVGLPARYVSGYLRTRPPPGVVARRGVDQSHAWVGAWLGADHGWVDLDPTNDLIVQDEHVVLGWGRDYTDVSPVRGMILGGGAHSVTAAVDLEPV